METQTIDTPTAEVAEALDIPVGTVRSRLHRARQRVRHSLDHDPTFTQLRFTTREDPSWTT